MKNISKQGSIIDATPWLPFRYKIFRILWIAALVSNIGTWMHEVGAAWLMTSLTTTPILVALVQAMTSLSIFLLALPAGALADIIDRRRYLIILQTYMMIIAGTLTVVTYLGFISPQLLLTLTFCLGAGAAMTAPTWQAIIPELVPNAHLAPAVTLNSVGINISRAIGPATAGIIIALAGPAAVFALNTLSFFGIIVALSLWRRQPNESTLPAERFYGAMRAGLRYLRGSPALLNLLARSSAFFIFASATWALLPLVAKTELHVGSIGYGVMLGLLGAGAVLGALFLPRIRELLNNDQLIFMGTIAFSITSLTLSQVNSFSFACVATLLGGIAWIVILATLNTVAQRAASPWVRARALSIWLTLFFGCMAIGSALWGWVATHYSISTALLSAAIGLIVGSIATFRFTIGESLMVDHTLSGDLPAPTAAEELEYKHGPVMVTVEYCVATDQIKEFTKVMKNLRRIRLREGAFFWKLFKDVEEPHKFVECFMVESWLEHLRYHERVTVTDRKIQTHANTFHAGKKSPHVTHLVAYDLHEKE